MPNHALRICRTLITVMHLKSEIEIRWFLFAPLFENLPMIYVKVIWFDFGAVVVAVPWQFHFPFIIKSLIYLIWFCRNRSKYHHSTQNANKFSITRPRFYAMRERAREREKVQSNTKEINHIFCCCFRSECGKAALHIRVSCSCAQQ